MHAKRGAGNDFQWHDEWMEIQYMISLKKTIDEKNNVYNWKTLLGTTLNAGHPTTRRKPVWKMLHHVKVLLKYRQIFYSRGAFVYRCH